MGQYFAFQWHITEECDQRCKHCYIFAENTCKKLDSMTWNEMKTVVKNVEEFCNTYKRSPYFYITGGDPILHPDFWKLMGLLKKKEIPFTILGNPFHLTDEILIRLKKYGCDKYQLSIDGTRNTHDWFRKPGSFDETVEKIGMINNSGITSVVMTTVSSVNIKEIPDIIDTVVKSKTDVFAFARYVPTSNEKSTGISPIEYRALLEACDKKYKKYRNDPECVTYFTLKDHLWTLYQYEVGDFRIPETAKEGMIYGGCNCGNCHITILPTGEVYACRRVKDSRVGNVFKDRLKDLWIEKVEEYRDYSKFNKCSKCKLLAWCRGCPAVAKGTYGDFYAEDPQCWLETSPCKDELMTG
ncbi:MAG: radical SAM/SPASM domain protein, ACGX system [Lachnospiraceae bacterium]|nr:radical SAM/SPASM domain protein, ACGX system [Lachnospiraceae bacterium]